jgi:hypothetical protein
MLRIRLHWNRVDASMAIINLHPIGYVLSPPLIQQGHCTNHGWPASEEDSQVDSL